MDYKSLNEYILSIIAGINTATVKYWAKPNYGFTVKDIYIVGSQCGWAKPDSDIDIVIDVSPPHYGALITEWNGKILECRIMQLKEMYQGIILPRISLTDMKMVNYNQKYIDEFIKLRNAKRKNKGRAI